MECFLGTKLRHEVYDVPCSCSVTALSPKTTVRAECLMGDQRELKQIEQSSLRKWDYKCSSACSQTPCAVTNCQTVMPEAERPVLWLRHTAISFLFVFIPCSSVSLYGAEVIMPFPFLACFASSLGQGMLCALSVVQQGSCDHSVLNSHLTPWSRAHCPARW